MRSQTKREAVNEGFALGGRQFADLRVLRSWAIAAISSSAAIRRWTCVASAKAWSKVGRSAGRGPRSRSTSAKTICVL